MEKGLTEVPGSAVVASKELPSKRRPSLRSPKNTFLCGTLTMHTHPSREYKPKWEPVLEPFPTQTQVGEAQTVTQPRATALPPGSRPPSPLLASQSMRRADLREEQGLPARCHMHSEVSGCSWHLLLGWPAALSHFLVPIPSISFGEFTTAQRGRSRPSNQGALLKCQG